MYPPTRVVDSHDTLAGQVFADPYRWLEADNDEVRGWQAAQGSLAARYVRAWPHFERLRSLLARLSAGRSRYVPRFAGGLWFWLEGADGDAWPRAMVGAKPLGDGRVLFDPMWEHSAEPADISWLSPSPDGRRVAIGLCSEGREVNTIHLLEVATGKKLADPPTQMLMDNWTGGAQWLADSSGFFFSAISGPVAAFDQQVYLHRCDPVAQTELMPVQWTTQRDYRAVFVSRDGRWAVAVERSQRPIPVAVALLSSGQPKWRPFVTEVQGTVAGHALGDKYIAVSDVNAPRGRLVQIDLSSPNPNDVDTWEELVPESQATMRTVIPVADKLYITEIVATYTRVRIVDYHGRECGTLPLPCRGAIEEEPFPLLNLVPKGHPGDYLFSFSSLTQSGGIYRYAGGSLETLVEPEARLDDALVEDREAGSADGTPVPYHVVRMARLNPDQPHPALIHAYGGFNLAFMPRFSSEMAAFVASGGVLVHAHLRGGGEFGRLWWENGRLTRKQNCYADLFAVAEDLLARGITSPRLLAVVGASNGGLMAGVAVTQRPDLWAVGVPRVPLLDLVGGCRDAYTRMAIAKEIGDPECPSDVLRLAALSPYHRVVDGGAYPAVFVDAGAVDPRCPAWHARKFAARLQAAQQSDAPVLLRVHENAGHGAGSDGRLELIRHTEWLAFVMKELGLTPGELAFGHEP